MGIMDRNDREEMVMGLRLKFLSRSNDVREAVLNQLPGDPFQIMRNISVDDPSSSLPSKTLVFDVLSDKKGPFAMKLNKLLGNHAGQEYMAAQKAMVKRNRDHTGNRNRIVNWWEGWNSAVLDTVKDDLSQCLLNTLPRGLSIRFFWDCTLTEGEVPKVICRDENHLGERVPDGMPTIIFQTDKKWEVDGGPVSDPNKKGDADAPLDEDPVF